MESLSYAGGKQDSDVFHAAASDTQKTGDEDLGMDKDKETAADVRRGLISTVIAETPPITNQQLSEHKQYETKEEVQAANLSKAAFGETDPATGEGVVLVSPSVNYQLNTGEGIHSPTSCESEQSLLGHSQTDQAHTSAEDMGKDSIVDAPNPPFPTTYTQQEKGRTLCSSLLHQMKSKQKHKAGRPFKKKTVLILSIAQGWDSETETPKGNRCKDSADECQESENKVKHGTPEAITVSTSSDTSLGCNSSSDYIDNTHAKKSEDTDTARMSQISSPKPLMDLNKPCKRKPCKRNAKATQITKPAEMQPTAAPEEPSILAEQGLAQGTLSPTETLWSSDKAPGNAPMVQQKARKKKAMALMEEMGLSQSDHLPALFQNNRSMSREKCPSVLTEVDLSDVKTGPVDLTSAGDMAVKSNSMKQRKQMSKKNVISADSCSIHPGMHLLEHGEDEPSEMDVTPHDQGQSDSNKLAINDAAACTTAAGIHRKMSMKTEESGVMSTGDMLKLKRKPGRPLKKKTLMKMANLMAIVHEDEVVAPKSLPDMTSLKPMKSKIKCNKNDTKNTPPMTTSLIGIGSAEVALPHESHSFDESNIKNIKIKKSIITSEGTYHSKFTPESKVLPEITSMEKSFQKSVAGKNTDIGAKQKCKQGSSHIDHDKMSCSFPTSTVTNLSPLLQKPHKCGIRNRQCKEEVVEVTISNPSVSHCQSGVPNHNASPEAPLLPSCVKIECDSDAPFIAKSCSKTSRDERKVKMSSLHPSDFQPSEIKSDLSHVLHAKAKTSRKRKFPCRGLKVNAKRAIVLTADPSLGEMPAPSSQPSCDAAKHEKEAVSSGTSLACKHEPCKRKGARRKLNEADITSNHDIQNGNLEKKVRVKKGITAKTNKLNLSSTRPQSEVNNAVADNNSIAPTQDPVKTVKPKPKMSSLLFSYASQPLLLAQQKGKLSKKSPASPRQKGKASPGNNVSKNKQEPGVMFADIDNFVPEMEKGIENKGNKSSGKKGTRNTGDFNLSSTHTQSEVNSADKSPNQNPSIPKPSDKKHIESDHPNSVKRTQLQKEQLSRKSPVPPRQKGKASLGNNASDKIKTLRPKRKLINGNNVSKDDLEDESASHSGTNTKNDSIFTDSTMVNSGDQKQDGVLQDSTHGSNTGPASQLANNSCDVTGEESKELCKTSLTKPPTKVAGVKKRFRRNRTGWDTRTKPKQHGSKLRISNTVDVLSQPSLDIPELSFSSNLCNSMLDETIINIELNEQIGQSYNQPPESTTCHKKNVQCDQKKTLQKIRRQTIGKKHEAQCVKRCPKRVQGEREAICAISTAKTDLLRSYMKPRRPIQCFFCRRSFRHLSAFTVHQRIHTGEKPYRCLKCGKRFAHLSKLHLHSKIHKQPEPIRCPCCSLMFSNKEEFIAHFKIHIKGTKKKPSLIKHKGDGSKVMTLLHAAPVNTSTPLRCLSCFKEFVSSETLKVHMLQTNCRSFSPYTHNVPDMKFNKSSSFNIHERSHWPVKPYACSVCGKGFDQLRKLGIHTRVHSGEKPFFCSLCDQTFSSLAALRTHQTSVCSEKPEPEETEAEVGKVNIEGFLVEQGVDGQINTPMYFKCQICKQLHRHWCQYILHLRTHTKIHPYLCEACGQQYNRVPERCVHCQACCKKSGEERACKASLSEVWQEPPSLQNRTPKPYSKFPSRGYKEEPSPGSTSVMSCGSEHQEKQPTRYHSRLLLSAMCGRYSCARCGKSFNQWNKLWLHQKLHRQKGSCFSCTQCSLEFRFFGSYREHMQEHAAQSPFACPLCPKAFVVEEDLRAHLVECHKPHGSLKCDTCGKGFKSFRNLEKHCVLHKGASSHYCLPCNMSFSTTCALQDHLKSHKPCPHVPLPVGPVEPFLFPYHCRKCKARFTSTDLLQAHQVFHLGEASEDSDPESTPLCSKLSKTVREEVTPVTSRQKQTLPVTKRKNIFRYPHPDRLYVVPIMSSEPPVIISDTEEDLQVVLISPSTRNSPTNDTSAPAHEGRTSSNDASMEVSTPRLPEFIPPPVVLINDIETVQCTPASREVTSDMSVHEQPSVHSPPLPSTLGEDSEQNVLPHSKETSSDVEADDEGEDDDDDDDDEDLVEASKMVIPRDKEQGCDGFECVECLAFFTEVSELHEHYVHHARGLHWKTNGCG